MPSSDLSSDLHVKPHDTSFQASSVSDLKVAFAISRVAHETKKMLASNLQPPPPFHIIPVLQRQRRDDDPCSQTNRGVLQRHSTRRI